jgi:signal transduction histidine kinase/DNA-binding response OmpR family regulator/HPt (histidine-containing phosphotransfer) domain-containing protein
VERADRILETLQDGHVAMVNQETGLRGFLVTRDLRFLEPYHSGADELARLDRELTGLVRDDAGSAALVSDLQAAEQRWIVSWAEPILAAPPAVTDTRTLGERLLRGKRLFDDYRAVQSQVRATAEEQRRAAARLQGAVLVGGALLGLAVTGGVAVAVRRANRRLTAQVLPPTRRLRDALAALTAGDVGVRVPETGPDELRRIAADVNALGEALCDRDALVAARERDLLDARDQAERAGAAKTAFLATMSHEIRTPLNAVLGLTDVLLTTELDVEQRGHLETIARSGDSLLTLINDVLDFSKIEAGELDLEQAPFDLDELVYDVAQLLAQQAAAKGLDLLVDVSGDACRQVVGDGARLRQVLVNLVGNAVKFTAAGQVVVTLSGEPAGDRVACRIAVSDTGIGIPAGQRHRLFRSFSQVDPSTTRSHGGTGLGLAISRRIARAMGGDITVASEPGAGSTFTVDLDLGLAAPGVPPSHPGGLDGRRLLVVDDNPTNLRILRHQLSRAGADCVTAGGAEEALELARGTGFDAAVVDLHMPGTDGARLAERLRALPETAALPLVLLSSSAALRPDLARLFTARLNKPVRPERLVRTLRSVVEPAAGADRQAPGTPAAGAVPAGTGHRPLRVLVAEDNAVNAQLMSLYLHRLGHDGTVVGDGAQAVRAVAEERFDVVLMDAQMPVLGGVDATAAIRAAHGPRPVVVAVTAGALAADRAAFLAAGADAFLTKPVRLAVLAAALEDCAAGAADPDDRPGDPAGVPARVPADPVLDPATVEELRDLGDELLSRLYGQYLDGLDAALDELAAAAARGSWDDEEETSVPRLAHRLKGGSGALGLHGMAGLCARLEQAAAAPPAELDRLLDEVRAERGRVHDAVAALLAPAPVA